MRLAISNIAWHPHEAEAALEQLHALGVEGLEIAPGLAFATEADPFRPNPEAIREWRSKLDQRGLTLVSMQSLLFGRPDVALFGQKAQREGFESGIETAIELAKSIGCPTLVLGSPTARSIPDEMDRATAREIALDVMGRLGDRCGAIGACLALEPNPAAYGTNFLNTLEETATFVRAVAHPAVRVNLDLGALIMNGETDTALQTLPESLDLIGHVHISEPHLAPAPADVSALSRVLAALMRAGHQGWVSIEMRAASEDNLGRVRDSLVKAQAAIQQVEAAAG
ncbi:sugar phosphate isomerase/epimerase family protein [Brevundimonas sp.]|jgi:sugar phosphate isomerase/epimerase|uniref:sugar phosphate isomerase/epimerase family protein n=1 Tax=Brevundimonas sp. TaxID=1871086 RepID=UPI00391D0658|nr:sugar phosphate isomerase/epimerase [Brevundimonas sp.]MCA3719351.1 sugar phosphate isomerase/epimerase [Brevundimonas sp.]